MGGNAKCLILCRKKKGNKILNKKNEILIIEVLEIKKKR